MVNVLINTLVAFLIGGATLSFNLKVSDASGAEIYNGKGTVVTLGDKYRMETEQIIAVSNGSITGIYQKEADEIVLQPVSTGSGDIMANPFALLQNGSANYEISTRGTDAKGLPKEIVMKAKNGTQYIITIFECTSNPASDSTLFILNPADYPTAYITDFR